MNKKNLAEKLLMDFQKRAENLKSSFESARQEAIAAPGAMQSKSDTTKFQMGRLVESSYISYLQIQCCISSLKKIDLIKNCKVIKSGTIVKLKERQSENYYFILPSECVGQNFKFEKQEINAITTNSPIAQALLNKKIGDVINVKTPSGLNTFKIIEIDGKCN